MFDNAAVIETLSDGRSECELKIESDGTVLTNAGSTAGGSSSVDHDSGANVESYYAESSSTAQSSVIVPNDHIYSLADLSRLIIEIRSNEEGISPDYPPKSLSKITEAFPEVDFEMTEQGLVATANVSERELKRTLKLSDDFVEVTTALISESLKVRYWADGYVSIDDNGWDEWYLHNLDLEKLKPESETGEHFTNALIDYFWSEINSSMDDPFLQDYLEDEEMGFERGNYEDLERAITLFLLTEPKIKKATSTWVRIETDDGCDGAHLYADYPEDCYYSERMDKLVEIAIEENYPVGYGYEYNDGHSSRSSGYSQASRSIDFSISDLIKKTPAREKMKAKKLLQEWLEQRGYKLEDFE